jgi:hypothetical protein
MRLGALEKCAGFKQGDTQQFAMVGDLPLESRDKNTFVPGVDVVPPGKIYP